VFHSTWDLEVHARDMQERRQDEAARARQMHALARSAGQVRHSGLMEGIARFLARVSATVSPARGIAPAPAMDHADVELEPARFGGASGSAERIVRERLAAQAEPFAAMVVIASGQTSKPVEQPRVGSDF
jgi:hypothetical protein